MLDLVLTVFILSSPYGVDSADPPPGHLQPIGSHRPPMTSIEERNCFPTPKEMFEKYVKASKPVIFRGILEKGMLPAYKLWTDEYLREKYGPETVDVESGKKEDRKWNMLTISLADFLNRYQTDDIYMVNDVSPKMAEDINMPSMFLCGGFQNVVQNVIMWFSSGGTKSVLHNDGLDNINCLIDGEKYFVMIDKKHKSDVEDSGWISDGQYSKVDVEKVDLFKFPKLRDLPWYEIKMHKGDCIFIPYKWYHHVDSKNGRNLAINIWIHHLTKFNNSDCNDTRTEESTFVSVSQFRKERKVTDFRDFLLGELEDLKHIDWPTFENFVKPFSLLKSEEIETLFSILDADGDDKIIEHEVMIANMENLFQQIPSLQHLLEENPYEPSEVSPEEQEDSYVDRDLDHVVDKMDDKDFKEQHTQVHY